MKTVVKFISDGFLVIIITMLIPDFFIMKNKPNILFCQFLRMSVWVCVNV